MTTRFVTIGRLCFALALIAFGAQQFIYGDFVPGRAPAWPEGVPGRLVWACVSGAVFVAAGVAMIAGKRVWLAGVTVGTTIFLWALLRHVPYVVADSDIGGAWTAAGKALAFFGGAFAVAASDDGAGEGAWREWFVYLGRFCLGAFLALGGIQHLLFPEFVATLVPGWIPGHLFWTYFAAVALIAGGVGLMLPKVARPAAALSGLMVFLWFLILHIPRAVVAADAQRRNELTAVFESLAVAGIAFLLAGLVRERARVVEPQRAQRLTEVNSLPDSRSGR